MRHFSEVVDAWLRGVLSGPFRIRQTHTGCTCILEAGDNECIILIAINICRRYYYCVRGHSKKGSKVKSESRIERSIPLTWR